MTIEDVLRQVLEAKFSNILELRDQAVRDRDWKFIVQAEEVMCWLEGKRKYCPITSCQAVGLSL